MLVPTLYSRMALVFALLVPLLLSHLLQLEAAEGKHGTKEDELFKMCDVNNDSQISSSELKKCAKFPNMKGDIAKEVFRVFDKDHDEYLSTSEYFEFVSMAFDGKGPSAAGDDDVDPDEEVEVIDRDGKKKIMKKRDFDKMNHQKMKGLSMEDGEMTKMEEGETTLEKAREENPDLARVLAIGEWIQDQLAEMDYAKGKMVNMKTIDSRVEGMDGQQKLRDNLDYEMKFEVQIRASQKKKSEVKVFEVWLERNRDLYLRPHLAVTHLWRIKGSERLELAPPPPMLRSAFVRKFLAPFVRNFGTPILLLLLCTVIWCTIKSCQNAKRGMRRDRKQD